jgi:hypothetical protein
MSKFSVAPASVISQPIRHLASLAAFGGQIVWPWVSIIALTGSLAFGMHQGIVREPNAHSTSDDEAAVQPQSTVTSTTAVAMPSELNATWIVLTSVGRQGASRTMACITRPNLFAADTLELDPATMDHLAAQLRCYSQTPELGVPIATEQLRP